MAQQSDTEFVIGELNSDVFKAPDNPDRSIVDSKGNEWKQLSKCGYFRLCDKYFWPSDPRSPAVVGSMVKGLYPPTVEQIKQQRVDELVIQVHYHCVLRL